MCPHMSCGSSPTSSLQRVLLSTLMVLPPLSEAVSATSFFFSKWALFTKMKITECCNYTLFFSQCVELTLEKMLAWAHFQPVCKQKLQHCKLWNTFIYERSWSGPYTGNCMQGVQVVLHRKFSNVVSQNTSTAPRTVFAPGTSPMFGLMEESLEVKRWCLFLWVLCQASVKPREILSSPHWDLDLGFALLRPAHTAQSPGLPAGVAQQLPATEWGSKAGYVA